ncbi:hypothetical protein JCM11491_005688 [Sporobolomyces phaffii]
MSVHSTHEKPRSLTPESPHLDRHQSTSPPPRSTHTAPILASQPRDDKPSPMRDALKKTVLSGIMLVVVFWICALWLFGLFYKNSEHAHRLRILVVDFDGSSVGSALLASVAQVNGQETWPTFVTRPANSTSPAEVQQRVFDGEFWGGIWASEGATSRFEAALASTTAASAYNPTQAISYTGNEVRYNTAWSAFVLAPLNRIVQSTISNFGRRTVAPLMSSGTAYSSESAAVLANPVAASFVNLVPFEFGSRIVFNTIGFVFPSLFQFFFILGINGIFTMTGAYRGMSLGRHYKLRLPLGFVWTLVTALCLVGWDLMFKESFYISPKNFFGLLGIVWLNNYITFLFFDCLATFVPPAFFSYPTSLWIIISVASVIYPLELANVFYRVHYAVPAHATWEIVITVLSHGGASTLYYNLPILFAWLVLLHGCLSLALRKRARDDRAAGPRAPALKGVEEGHGDGKEA